MLLFEQLCVELAFEVSHLFTKLHIICINLLSLIVQARFHCLDLSTQLFVLLFLFAASCAHLELDLSQKQVDIGLGLRQSFLLQ